MSTMKTIEDHLQELLSALRNSAVKATEDATLTLHRAQQRTEVIAEMVQAVQSGLHKLDKLKGMERRAVPPPVWPQNQPNPQQDPIQ